MNQPTLLETRSIGDGPVVWRVLGAVVNCPVPGGRRSRNKVSVGAGAGLPDLSAEAEFDPGSATVVTIIFAVMPDAGRNQACEFAG